MIAIISESERFCRMTDGAPAKEETAANRAEGRKAH
jgi:hypothetical protein